MEKKLTKYQKALDQNYLQERLIQRLKSRIKPEQLINLYKVMFKEDEVLNRYVEACKCEKCNLLNCECKQNED